LKLSTTLVLALAAAAALLPLILRIPFRAGAEEIAPVTIALFLTASPYILVYLLYLHESVSEPTPAKQLAALSLSSILLVVNIFLYAIPLSRHQPSTAAIGYFFLPFLYLVATPILFAILTWIISNFYPESS
jgi:drug/metabolite transporter (DMT)-like permease